MSFIDGRPLFSSRRTGLEPWTQHFSPACLLAVLRTMSKRMPDAAFYGKRKSFYLAPHATSDTCGAQAMPGGLPASLHNFSSLVRAVRSQKIRSKSLRLWRGAAAVSAIETQRERLASAGCGSTDKAPTLEKTSSDTRCGDVSAADLGPAMIPRSFPKFAAWYEAPH
jgi:hypothetical protein